MLNLERFRREKHFTRQESSIGPGTLTSEHQILGTISKFLDKELKRQSFYCERHFYNVLLMIMI